MVLLNCYETNSKLWEENNILANILAKSKFSSSKSLVLKAIEKSNNNNDEVKRLVN